MTETSDGKDSFDFEEFMRRLDSGELDEACTKLLRYLGIREPESSDQEDAYDRACRERDYSGSDNPAAYAPRTTSSDQEDTT